MSDQTHPHIRLQGLDDDTKDTLRKMVRYVRDDDRIAAHLRIDMAFVREARELEPAGVRHFATLSRKPIRDEMPANGQPEPIGMGEDQFTRNAKAGSVMLGQAIERMIGR